MFLTFSALAPGTLRPVDPLLSAMLTYTVDLTKLRDVQRWLGFVVLALPILTNQSPEEAILARLEELGMNHIYYRYFLKFYFHQVIDILIHYLHEFFLSEDRLQSPRS